MSRPGRTLSDREKVEWLRLSRTQRVGPVTFHALIARFGTAESALEALPALAERAGRRRTLQVASRSEVESEMRRCEKIGVRLIASCEPDYPEALAAIEDAPPVIAVGGDASLLHRPSVAIVGARNASLSGRRIAEALAGELGRAGLVIVSGLARGIDTAAHRAAVATGTVAVVAGGVDITYPPENAGLQAQIMERGCIVAEAPLGTEPLARHFPRRNRIISGLAPGVVVVEAARQSGSLITARMALEQGREVFAVPGSPLDPRAQGCNNLIRQGATLTETADDVLRVLQTFPARGPAVLQPELPALAVGPKEDGKETDETRRIVLEALGPTPVAVDELVRDCQVSLPVVLSILLELELAGRLERQPGQRVSLIS